MRVASKWAQLADCRASARKLMIERFFCRRQDFDLSLHFISEEKSGLNLMVDALAASIFISIVAKSVGAVVTPLLPVPRYIQDPPYRRIVEGRILNFIAADVEQEAEQAGILLKNYSDEAELAQNLDVYVASVHGDCACALRKAIAALGGVTKTANLIGVTPATINGWIAKGRILNPVGLRIFELADAELLWQELVGPCTVCQSA